MPAAWNHSAMSWFSAAAPEMKNRTRPPKRSRILLKTSLSKRPCCSLSEQRDGLALGLEPVDREPDLERLVEDLLLGAALGLLHGDDPAVRLLEDARSRAHERRLHDAEVLDDLVDPAVDRGREAAGELGGEQHLAEGVRHRQPQELEVVLVQDVLHLDRGALVDPRAVPQPDALGAAGGARGVDQGRELVGADRLGGLRRSRPGARRGTASPSLARSSRPMTQSPSVVPSKVTTLPGAAARTCGP